MLLEPKKRETAIAKPAALLEISRSFHDLQAVSILVRPNSHFLIFTENIQYLIRYVNDSKLKQSF